MPEGLLRRAAEILRERGLCHGRFFAEPTGPDVLLLANYAGARIPCDGIAALCLAARERGIHATDLEGHLLGRLYDKRWPVEIQDAARLAVLQYAGTLPPDFSGNQCLAVLSALTDTLDTEDAALLFEKAAKLAAGPRRRRPRQSAGHARAGAVP
jgi:hypothetical protein